MSECVSFDARNLVAQLVKNVAAVCACLCVCGAGGGVCGDGRVVGDDHLYMLERNDDVAEPHDTHNDAENR